MDTLLWYLEITLDYIAEMLPCMVIGGAVFLLLLPSRQRKLHQNHLSSGKIREVALFLFVMFCTGRLPCFGQISPLGSGGFI